MKVVDMHCDTISELYYGRQIGKTQDLRENTLHIDLRKMKRGDYLLQNFAMFVDMGRVQEPFEHVVSLMDLFYQEMEKNKNDIRVIKTYQDILDNQKEGCMSAMLTVEEGGCCKGNLAFLRTLYRLGARMMTLTWNYPNELGFPNTPGNEEKGLTQTGISFVEEMERLGMIIDVSHLSDAGFHDVVKYTRNPFVASHSNARAICNNHRNLTDDMIRLIGERGGVIGLNYFGYFLRDGQSYSTCLSRVEDMAKHARHMIQVGGSECLGLGSDFDGITGELEMKDCSTLPMLEEMFAQQGFTAQEIEGIFHKNVLRVYKELL